MPLQIKSSARIESAYCKVLVFGQPHKGKTVLTATAPRPILLLTEPTGADSLSTANLELIFPRPSKEQVTAWLKEQDSKLKGKELEEAIKQVTADPSEMTGITYDVPRFDVFNREDFGEAVKFLQNDAGKKPDDRQFDTVVVDSASQLSTMLLTYYKANSGKDPRRAYKKAADEVQTLFDQLLNLPMHTVFLTHATEYQQNLGTTEEPVWYKYFGPTFEGQELRREIPHKLGEIYQIETALNKAGLPEPYLRTRPDNPSLGKERSRNAGLAEKEEANLTKIFAKLRRN